MMPSDAHEANAQDDVFMAWSKGRGIRIDGIKSAQIPGRGRGIVAQRRIEVFSSSYGEKRAESGNRRVRRLYMYLLRLC